MKTLPMRFPLRALMVLFCGLMLSAAWAQDKLYEWKVELVPADVRAGEAAQLHLKLTMKEGWHAYQIGQTGGPLGISIKLDETGPLEAVGEPIGPKPLTKFDKAFGVEVGYYEKLAIFALPVRVKEGAKGDSTAKVETRIQVCDASGCDRPRTETWPVPIHVQPGEARIERIAASVDLPEQPAQQAPSSTEQPESLPKEDVSQGSLWGILLAGFSGGLLALLTPCVFPMIPVTISFFSKQGDDRKAHVRAALLYCVGIVVSFTVLGMLVTIALGKNGTYILANNLWINGGLFLLFVFLAMSLFGVFELILPSGMLTKITTTTSRSGSVAAPLLMGLTFALTSFTCTVPIVGSLLAGAATGDRLYPALGMIAFSSALALPFLLLAIFPQLLKKLPRSGSWMVTAKAFMGFLELAAALKFLSNIDLVLKLGILTRPVFLAVWAAIFTVAGLHLIGWILLPHDSPGAIGIVRRLFAAASLAAAGFCLAAMNGASLGPVSGLLPPSSYPGRERPGEAQEAGELAWIVNDYPKALAQSKESGKPLLIDFTGYT